MPQMTEKLPRWDMSNVYPGLESDELERDLSRLREDLETLDGFVQAKGIGRLEQPPMDLAAAAETLDAFIGRYNDIARVMQTVIAYTYGFLTTDSYNKVAARRMSELEQLEIRLQKCRVRLQGWIGSLGSVLPQICEQAPVAREHRAVLDLLQEQSRYLMRADLEDLAAELQLSGGGAVWKLQGTVTSQLKVPFEQDGKETELPITKIRNLAYDPDESVRRRAYEAELKAWESVREPVAFAMNSVKGSAVTLSRWRGRDDVLHEALDRNRIDRDTLEALLAAMRDSFPDFRRYFLSKAHKLGKQRLPWWDLFAPVGKANLSYTWEEARDYIVTQFGRFDDELAEFARRAFAGNWIDAEPRDGKRGGAFCMGLPAVEESRVLANFDGSFDQVVTLAHELGHGFHNHCQRGLPMMRRGAPMTLAETASIFCETIVFNAALADAPEEARLFILENQLIGSSQVVVDIYARFRFESEVLKRRAQSELSADEFNELILAAQKEAYGEVLDEEHLHPYMWLLKPHYYDERHFYNYPYAFGLLFGLGMYARYRQEGPAFIPRYKELLRGTAEGKVAELAGRFDIDVREKGFWADSLAIIREQIDRYCELAP
ncbi:MAG: M3 family oligoendopeptidase [Candidatus Eisenbacteria sp.]|nr:M3 family oligoendopeptidase [Candidatus Eisenbacteria bacterium]